MTDDTPSGGDYCTDADDQTVLFEVEDDDLWPELDGYEQNRVGQFTGPYDPKLEQLQEIGGIEIIEWDHDPEFTAEFDFPPEPLQKEDDSGIYYEILVPSSGGYSTTTIGFDSWQCVSCDSRVQTPKLRPDTTVAEIQPDGKCHSCDQDSGWELADIPSGLSHDDIEGCVPAGLAWESPSSVDDPNMGSLFDDVREHIRTHWDAGEGREWIYDGLAAHAIATWIRPDLDFVPHLLVHGTHESGKTRLLNTMKEVSYRCIHTAAPTASSIFRAVDNYNTTLYISEYHDLSSDVQDELDAVVKAGQKRGEVAMRTEDTEDGFKPMTFDPFTHVAISTQFSVDDDMESRCFKVRTRKTDGSMPRTVKDRSDLRDRLMGMRSMYLHSDAMEDAKDAAHEKMDSDAIFNRIGEKLSSILIVGELFDVDMEDFVEYAVQHDDESDSETEEASFLRATLDEAYDRLAQAGLDEVADDWSNLELKMKNVTRRFNTIEGRDVSPRYIAELRSRVDLGTKRYSDGTYISDADLKEKLKHLADRHNVEWGGREEGPSAGVIGSPDVEKSVADGGEDVPEDEDEKYGDGHDDPASNEYSTISQNERVSRVKDAVKNGNMESVSDVSDKTGISEDVLSDTIGKLIRTGVIVDHGDYLEWGA